MGSEAAGGGAQLRSSNVLMYRVSTVYRRTVRTCTLVTKGGEGEEFRCLLLLHHQFPVFDFQVAYVIGELQLIALLRELLLQGVVHQRDWDAQVSQFELSWFESGVAVFGSQVACDGYPEVFARYLDQELSFDHIAFKTELVVFDGRLIGAVAERSGLRLVCGGRLRCKPRSLGAAG